MNKKPTNTSVKVTAWILISIISILLLEMGARLIWKIKYNEYLKQTLHGFDYVDQSKGLTVNESNTEITLENYRNFLIEQGKTIGLQNLESEIENYGNDSIRNTTVIFRLNNYGFKGPDIKIPKPENVYRILTIGNSCTWGPNLGYYAYPRVMERTLNKNKDHSFKIEVVNAGVLGYNFERVLKRIDEWLLTEPDIITIYLGWNRTISRADPDKNVYLYRNLALYKIIYHFIINRGGEGLSENFESETFHDPDTGEIDEYNEISFRYDLKDLDSIIEKVKAKNNSIKVVIITLAGLFDWRIEPPESAVNKAYPIASTDNLYAWALLTRNFNEKLKYFAAEHKLYLIDFEEYAYMKFRPRNSFFNDSVHPTNSGYLNMGEFFSKQIEPLIPK